MQVFVYLLTLSIIALTANAIYFNKLPKKPFNISKNSPCNNISKFVQRVCN